MTFQYSTKKNIPTKRKLKLSRKGMEWGLYFVKKWKCPDQEREWILRDQRRGKWLNPRVLELNCPLAGHDQNGECSNADWDQRNHCHSITTLGKFPVLKFTWRNWKSYLFLARIEGLGWGYLVRSQPYFF